MSETMREAVARAIYKGEGEFYGPYEVLPKIGEFDPDTGNVESAGYYRYLADAAITTVLEFLAREFEMMPESWGFVDWPEEAAEKLRAMAKEASAQPKES